MNNIVNNENNYIFSLENTPDVSVIDAICASMSVPFLFIPCKIGDTIYVDGGMSNNFPINIFENVDKNNILGIIINTITELTNISNNKDTYNFIDYLLVVIKSVLKNSSQYTTLKYLNEDLLIIKDLPIKSLFNYTKKDDGYVKEISNDVFDNMILKGFIDISRYMKNRREKCIKDIL